MAGARRADGLHESRGHPPPRRRSRRRCRQPRQHRAACRRQPVRQDAGGPPLGTRHDRRRVASRPVSTTTLSTPSVDTLAREHPEFGGWLDLLSVVADEAATEAWADAIPDTAAAGVPLLAGATLTIDPVVVSAWLRRLLDVGARSAPVLASVAEKLDALVVLEAAMALDIARVDALAEALAVPAESLHAVLPLAAWPWLQGCGARLAERVPA